MVVLPNEAKPYRQLPHGGGRRATLGGTKRGRCTANHCKRPDIKTGNGAHRLSTIPQIVGTYRTPNVTRYQIPNRKQKTPSTPYFHDLQDYQNRKPPPIIIGMPYPERIRNWWLRVAGNGDEANARCQIETYTEKRGFVECGSDNHLQVHHLYPESLAREDGENPDQVPGIVACTVHHVGEQREDDNLPFTGSFTFHPDIGKAHAQYRAGNKQAFAQAHERHKEAAANGERFWGGDEGSDQYYIEKQKRRGIIYQYTHPDDPKPTVKHVKPNHKPKKHWYDGLT